jgi:putative oxidoreductase
MAVGRFIAIFFQPISHGRKSTINGLRIRHESLSEWKSGRVQINCKTLITEISLMNTKMQAYAMAIARVLMALIFILSGLSKLGATEATAGYMEAMGVPGMLLWPTIAFEIGAGLLVALGYQTRIAAFLLCGFCLVTAVIFHHQFTDQIQMIMFLKNLAMAGGFLLLASVGPEEISLDAKRKST